MAHIISKGSWHLTDSSCFFPFTPFYESIVPFYFSDISNNKSTNVSRRTLRRKTGGGSKTSVFSLVCVGGSAGDGATAVIRVAATSTKRPGQTYNHHIRATTLCRTLDPSALFPLRSKSGACNLLLHTIFPQLPLQDCSSGPTGGRRGSERAQIFPKSSAGE